eukprot:gene508-678_t
MAAQEYEKNPTTPVETVKLESAPAVLNRTPLKSDALFEAIHRLTVEDKV